MGIEDRIRAALSPDMVPLFEQAERYAEEGLFERAEKIYEKLAAYAPGNDAIGHRLEELRTQGVAAPPEPAAGFHDESERTARSLLRDLGYGEADWDYGTVPLRSGLQSFFSLGPDSFKRVGLDVAVFAGVSGDWALSLEVLLKLIELGEAGLRVKLWHLRCLVELDRHAEALAVVNSVRWSEAQRIHVNYLAGIAFEALGIGEQARQRFDAVHKADPRYRNIAQKVLVD
jgi:tetratricopeptide (TPR) repeat protein